MTENDLKERLYIEISTLTAIREAMIYGACDPATYDMALHGVINRLNEVLDKV